MIEASRSDLVQFIRDRVEAARNGEEPELTSAKQIREEFGRTLTDREITAALQEAGALRLEQVRVGRDKVRPWALVKHDKWKKGIALGDSCAVPITQEANRSST